MHGPDPGRKTKDTQYANQYSLRKRGRPFQLPTINTVRPFNISFHKWVPRSVCATSSLPCFQLMMLIIAHPLSPWPAWAVPIRCSAGHCGAAGELLNPSCFIFHALGHHCCYCAFLFYMCIYSVALYQARLRYRLIARGHQCCNPV